MSFSTFFSRQARKPAGLFGRMVMSLVFDKGNAFLNALVNDLMSVEPNDHILEIGFGTGKLIHTMARQLDTGRIQGVDFSETMVSIAQKRNRKYIDTGKVTLFECNFDETSFKTVEFSKACSVNTLYFWPKPEHTAEKIADLLKPGGRFVLAFEDIGQLEKRKLNDTVFHLFSKDDVQKLLMAAGFSGDVRIESRQKGKSVFHCAVANKKS